MDDPTIYLGSAAHYRSGRPPYSPKLEGFLAEELGPDGSARLLDVGCGPGILTVRLARLFAQVVGLDPDVDMLAEGRRVAQELGLSNIRWVKALAEDLPDAAPGPFQLVTFGQSFHWTDELAVAETVYDMLEPGGMLALIVHTVEGRPRPPSATHTLRHTTVCLPSWRPRPGARQRESIVSGCFSFSWAAPHLFGERAAAFADEIRALLASRSPAGVFWDWPGDTEIVFARKAA